MLVGCGYKDELKYTGFKLATSMFVLSILEFIIIIA